MIRVLDDDGPGGEVAQALAFAVHEQSDQADPISVGQEVDDPDDVADPGLGEGERLTSIADRTQAEGLLADRLARPQRFAHPEVAKDDHEAAEDADQLPGHHLRERHGHGHEIDGDQDAAHDEKVQDLRDRPGPQPGYLVVERNALGSGNDEVAVRLGLHVR